MFKNLRQKLPEIIIIGLILIAAGISTYFFVSNLETTDYVVQTNAFFAPFEFYDNREIVGVDVEIINRVAAKLGKTIAIKDVEFDVIIDNVASGQLADAGAAGLTITDSRAAKVNFSTPYYTSVQYIIFDRSVAPPNNGSYILWDALKNTTLGSQTGGTGYLFAETEIDEGVLKNTSTEIKGFDTHQLAADAISAHIIDYAIADRLPAEYIIAKNPNLAALPLYYRGANGASDYPAEESYAIAVNKNHAELLEAFNSVLTEMLVKDDTGNSEIDRLVLKYMGLDNE